MLIHFKIDKYSRIADLDLLLTRLSERKISYLKMEKIEEEYDFEYTFSEEELERPTPKELYDAVFNFRKNFLGKKLTDASIHYFMEQDRMVINFSVIPPGVSYESLILDSIIHVERAIDLITSSAVEDLESGLHVKTPNSRKFSQLSVKDSLEKIRESLSAFSFF